jgi:tRNA (Thr-GGU) A37 N-methylase
LEIGMELVVITGLHQADRSTLQTHPRNDRSQALTGVFASRSADRTKPLSLHRVRVRERSGLHVRAGQRGAGRPTRLPPAKAAQPARRDV